MENTKENKLIERGNKFFLFLMLFPIILGLLPLPYIDVSIEYLGFLLPCIIYFWKFKEDRTFFLEHLKIINLKSILYISIIWLLCTPITGLLLRMHNDIFGEKISNLVSNGIPNQNSPIWIFIFVNVITPAICEEMALRGVILSTYRNKKILTCAIMNGLMFGMLHMNSYQFTHAFISGIVATYVFYATKSFFAPVFLHLLNNGVATLNTFTNSNSSSVSNLISNKIGIYIVLILLSIVCTYLCIKLIKTLAKVNKVDLISLDKEKTSNENVITYQFIVGTIIFVLSVILAEIC